MEWLNLFFRYRLHPIGEEAIAQYAGADIDQAHYYSYDLECLIKPALNVEHYKVLSGIWLPGVA